MEPAQGIDMFGQLVQSLGPVGALVAGFLIWRWMELRGEDKRVAPPPPSCSVAVDDALKSLAKQVEKTAAASERAALAAESATRVIESLAQSDHYEHKEISATLARMEAQR